MVIVSAGPETGTAYRQFNLEGDSKEKRYFEEKNQEKEKANIKTLNLPQWIPGNLIMHKDPGRVNREK